MPMPALRGALLVAAGTVFAACASSVISGLDTQGFDPDVRVQDDLFRAATARR